MGNRAQQIGPQLFVLHLHLGFLLAPGKRFLVQRQRAFAQHGEHQIVFKRIQRFPVQRNPDDAVHRIRRADGQIIAARAA